jgi:hypothetical protein
MSPAAALQVTKLDRITVRDFELLDGNLDYREIESPFPIVSGIAESEYERRFAKLN